MKASRSVDGRTRYTVQTKHRISGDQIARAILIFHASGFKVPEVGEPWTRAGLERFIRQVLTEHGRAGLTPEDDHWQDSFNLDGHLQQAVSWSCDLVRKLLPEVADDELARWEQQQLDHFNQEGMR